LMIINCLQKGGFSGTAKPWCQNVEIQP